MTQWKLAGREQRARESVSRIARLMMILAVAVLLGTTPARAAAHPLRTRRIGIARQPDRLKIDRVNGRGGAAVEAHSGHVFKERSRVRRVAVERNPERNLPVTMVQTRAGKLAAARRRGIVAQVARRDGHSSPELRRVSARRRRGARNRFAEQQRATEQEMARSGAQQNVSENDAAAIQAAPVRANLPVPKTMAEAVPAKGDTAEAIRAMPSGLGDARTRQELTAEVEQPLVLPGLYRNGRLVVPPPLRGTREILVHQNLMADDEGLQRIQNDYDLRRMRASRQLVDFPESSSLHVNPEMESDRRCARPWTVYFATDISRAFYARFHEPLQVNSAVRTVAYQVRLRRVNGNAAGVDGEAASPHLTGEALDFGKHGMSVQEIAWMRLYLLPLMQAGKLDVEEEFQQACFHISVYRTYEAGSRRRLAIRSEVAQLR